MINIITAVILRGIAVFFFQVRSVFENWSRGADQSEDKKSRPEWRLFFLSYVIDL